MTHVPAVSVIMANHNGAPFLGDSLQSLLKQTLKAWELIFVDDASTDDSVALARQITQGDSRVNILRQNPNKGPASARNRALEAARGEWIAVFDSDDVMRPQRLELLQERAKADDAAIVADNLLLFSSFDVKPRPFLKNSLGRAPHWIGLAELMASSRLYSSTPDLGYLKPMVKREVVHELGLRYDERLRIGEDFNFLARILAEGHRLRLYPSPMYLYRKHTSSVSHRLSADDIHGMMAADEFFNGLAGLTREETVLLKRRRHSLEQLLIFDSVITAVKDGKHVRAAGLALAHPFIWPLLTRPINARLKRMGEALLRKPAIGTTCPNPAD